MATIVTFGPNGARIHEGADEADFKGQEYLVNPKFPKGVAPHNWTKEQLQGLAPKKTFKLPTWGWALIGFVAGLLAHWR